MLADILRRLIPKSRSIKYGYSNARVKAMKGALLKGTIQDELIRVGSVEAMIELLQKTDYKQDLADAALNYDGSAIISAAASQNFARVVRRLVKVTPAEDRKALRALLIRWDLINLKTLLHAKKLDRGYDEVRHLLYNVGGLRESDFKKILKSDEETILRELRRSAIGDAFEGIKVQGNMFTYIESDIDSKIYKRIDNVLAKVGGREIGYIRDILRKEIDARNIMIIERLKKHNREIDLIEGGTLSSALVGHCKDAKDIQQVANLVRHKFHKLDVPAEATITDLEIALDRSVANMKKYAFGKEVLSLGVIIGFLLLKEEEINNLRKIAKGKEYGFTENEIRAMLV